MHLKMQDLERSLRSQFSASCVYIQSYTLTKIKTKTKRFSENVENGRNENHRITT